MPPYYPEQYQNQYPNQYSYGNPYNDQFNEYQYVSAPPAQQIPPFSQIQVNIPPRQPQNFQNSSDLQPQYIYNQPFHQNYNVTGAQLEYQFQPHSPYMPQQQYSNQQQFQHQQAQHVQNTAQYQQRHQHQQQLSPPQPQPRPQVQSQVEPHFPAQIQQQMQPQIPLQVQPPLQAQAQPLQQEQVQTQPSPQQPRPRSQPQPQPQPQMQSQVQSQVQSQAQPQPQPQPPSQLQMQSNQQHQSIPPYKPFPPQSQVNIPKAQFQHQSPNRVLKDAQPTAQRQQQNIPKPPTPKQTPELSEPDYEILLLSLADEYLESAQKLSIRSEQYFKLTATALGCIDAALNNFKLRPLREAQVSLKYAQLLFNETENHDDAERILTKTIDQCARLKYHDLKYAAQLLLTKVLYQSRPKAALKDLQGMIQDIEVYKHTAWEYAFRFQCVAFAMSSTQPNDAHLAIIQLQRICQLARLSGDHAILAFAAVLEALIHLQSTGSESIQSSQRSLAKARALQLNPDVENNPQICLMMEFVDLCAQIKANDINQSEQKRKTMQSVLYPALQKSSWKRDGLLYLPVLQSSLKGLQIQDNGLIADRNGKYFLAFSWLTKEEVEDLGYLLSGVSAARKSAGDGGKAEKFLDEGLDMIKEIQEETRSVDATGDTMRARQQLVQCHFLIETALLQCSRGQWGKAQASVRSIDSVIQISEVQFPVELKCLVEYIKGAIHQGKGNLDTALTIFQSPNLNIISQLEKQAMTKPSSQLHRSDEVVRNIAIIAGMNTVFIIQQPTHPQHHRLSSLLNTLDPLASQHTNKSIQAAWNFVLACLPNNTILKTKQHLGSALSAAQSISNAQITTLCLVTMQEKFFKGMVGDQSIKCARAASHQAKRLNEPKWIVTAGGLEVECLNLHGMLEEGSKKRAEMEKVFAVLPEKVRNHALVT